MIIYVYDQAQGDGGVYFVTYKGQPVLLASQGGTFSTSDVDGSYCIIKNTNSHTVTFKNRIGFARPISILITASDVK